MFVVCFCLNNLFRCDYDGCGKVFVVSYYFKIYVRIYIGEFRLSFIFILIFVKLVNIYVFIEICRVLWRE